MVKKCGLLEKNHKVYFLAAKIFLVKKLTCKCRQLREILENMQINLAIKDYDALGCLIRIQNAIMTRARICSF